MLDTLRHRSNMLHRKVGNMYGDSCSLSDAGALS